MEIWREFLLANRAWVNEKSSMHKSYFTEMSKGQSPRAFWVGCCDSRVPAEEVVGAQPGTIFVHRNVANQARAEDMNFMAALEYAVKVLKIEDIIVCGHYECGGVIAASGSETNLPSVELWIKNLRKTLQECKKRCSEKSTALDVSIDQLIEANVSQQVLNVNMILDVMLGTDVSARSKVTVHGWVFNMRNGIIHTLE